MGWWQVVVITACTLVKFPMAWQELGIMFLAPPMSPHCVDPPNITDACSPQCTNVTYDFSVFSNTMTTQYGLICSKAQYANLSQTIFMFGILVGSFVFGYLTDKYGRVMPLVFAVVMQAVAGSADAFLDNFVMFLVYRFLCAVATGGTMTTSFVFVMEVTGARWRSTISVLYQIPFNFGNLIMIGMAYGLRDWRYLQLAFSAPSILLASLILLPESARWLMATGQPDKAVKVLESAARFNKMPTGHIHENVAKGMKLKEGEDSHSGNIVQVFRAPNLRFRIICISINWVVCSLCYFGVSQYLGQLSGNIFNNTAISAAIQFPGTLFTLLWIRWFGRKKALIITLVGCAVSFLAILAIPSDDHWPITGCGAVGIFFMSAAFTDLYLYTGEMFPTVVRNVALGFASTCGRIGSMVAPYVANVPKEYWYIPPLVFGITPIIASLCLWKLPETEGLELPDTIEEGETLGIEDNHKTKENCTPNNI